MFEVIARPVDVTDFAPFGDVILGASGSLVPIGTRQAAPAVIERLQIPPVDALLSHTVAQLERHPCSTQAFCPLGAVPYLVVVAPDGPDGGPDLQRLRAFTVPADAVIQYRVGVWHAGLRTIGSPGPFAMHIHRDGSPSDCEFVSISAVRIRQTEHSIGHERFEPTNPTLFSVKPLKETV